MKTILGILLLLLTANAAAAERKIPLTEGKRLWSILKAEGCSPAQIANHWKEVALDSGLDPEANGYWPADGEKVDKDGNKIRVFITLRRDCYGKLLVDPQETIVSLTRQLEESGVNLTTAMGTIGKWERGELKRKNAPPPPSPPLPWQTYLVSLGGGLILGFTTVGLVVIKSRINKESYEVVRKVKYLGNPYYFRFAGISETSPDVWVIRRQCPLCTERNLIDRAEILIRHIETNHAGERIVIDIDDDLQAAADE